MVVTVRLFAGLRERAGRDRVEVELPEEARVSDLLAAMDVAPRSCVVAINREYADEGARVRAGEEVAAAHGLSAVALEHRTGTVPLGEPSVIVAASAPHRGEAFEGARALIDRVKAEAPIWKVEVDAEGGRTRVEGTLPSAPSG